MPYYRAPRDRCRCYEEELRVSHRSPEIRLAELTMISLLKTHTNTQVTAALLQPKHSAGPLQVPRL